ncbi:hypothetical protein [Streptomyces sp. wa13]|uniref:hypothetical protein n=1 Tax=Streptomyces sp. wa13 TaxID=1828236 RepID=UPI003C7A887A
MSLRLADAGRDAEVSACGVLDGLGTDCTPIVMPWGADAFLALVVPVPARLPAAAFAGRGLPGRDAPGDRLRLTGRSGSCPASGGDPEEG